MLALGPHEEAVFPLLRARSRSVHIRYVCCETQVRSAGGEQADELRQRDATAHLQPRQREQVVGPG